MNLRERRKAGVTFLNIRRILKNMSEEERQQSPEILSVVVLNQLVVEKPQGFFEDLDWDKLLEFIEKLIELILRVLPLFI
jgi:hypothetical protein